MKFPEPSWQSHSLTLFHSNSYKQWWETRGLPTLSYPSVSHNQLCLMKLGLGCDFTWPRPKSVPCGRACPFLHHVAVDHRVTSQHQRHRSRALGKGLYLPNSGPSRYGWGRRGPWLQGGCSREARNLRGESETPTKEASSRRVWPGSVSRECCGWTLITYLLRYT